MNTLTIATFLGATIAVAVFTIFFVRRMKKSDNPTEEYFTGGRALTWPIVAGSLLLTNLSTEQLTGLNGAVFSDMALVGVAWEALAAFAMIATAVVFLPRYLASGFTTTPAFLEKRFDKTTRSMVSGLFLAGYVTVLLPVVLVTGAKAIIPMFDLTLPFWMIAAGIGLLGSTYAIFGGLKAVAVSDTINGVGLLIGGLAIPVLGLVALGDGSFGAGLATLTSGDEARYLEVLTVDNVAGEEVSVPWPTLLTGMMFIQIFYWSTNQVIVQRAMGATNLAEGQKGVLFASGLKLIGPLMLCVPAIIALHLMHELPMVKAGEETQKAIASATTKADFTRLGVLLDDGSKSLLTGLNAEPQSAAKGTLSVDELRQRLSDALKARTEGDQMGKWTPTLKQSREAGLNVNDYVYGIMVKHTLPPWSLGLFLAVLVGAILSSFNSALNSASTLFSLQFYKGYINPEATPEQVVRTGRNFGIGIAIAAIAIAPLLAAQASIFKYLQMVNGLYSVPIIAIFLLGIGTKRIPASGAKLGMLVGILAYGVFTFFGGEIKEAFDGYHWLHGYFVSFLAAVVTMFAIGQLKPKTDAEIAVSDERTPSPVDMTPWKHLKSVSWTIVALTVAMYVILQSLAS